MLAKPKRETTHWKTLSTVISIHNLCGFSIHSKCIGTVSSISSEDNAPLFFVALVFFKAGVYSRISSVSAMHGIAQFVLCDFSQQHFFLFSTFIQKKNYLRILEVLFLLYNFSSLVKILAKLFCSLKCLWVNKIYGNQLWLKRKWRHNDTSDLAILWSRLIGQISEVLITVLKKGRKWKKRIKHNIMYTVASKCNLCANFCFSYFFSDILMGSYNHIVLTHVHAGLLVIAGNCSVNHVRDKNRKENNFLKKSCVVSEIRYEFFFQFLFSLLWSTNYFFYFENEQAQKKDSKIHCIDFRLLFRLRLGKSWFNTDHCWLDLILDVKWILYTCLVRILSSVIPNSIWYLMTRVQVFVFRTKYIIARLKILNWCLEALYFA